MSGVELKNMGQQILGSYPVHFHLAEDVDERGGYECPMYLDNLAIHHCLSRAVSTFWIANPNNNLIENAAAGAQDVGIWDLFHRVAAGESDGRYPEGQAEHSPLGVFYNRVHSNFKAGLFIGKGVKTTRAKAEGPREHLAVGNARFSDNGIGLTLASDETFPTDGSSPEVTGSIFGGESSNFGSQGGQNSYWGKEANGEYRTLPRNKTFPIHGLQIYDRPVGMGRCTSKKFTLTVDRYSSATGFFMKNSWQTSPQNNVLQILMEKSLYIQARCPENLTLCTARAAFPSHPVQLQGVNRELCSSSTSLSSCSSRIISSSEMAEHLRMSCWTTSTSTDKSVFLFTSTGIFFVVLDACSGAVVGRQNFGTVSSENTAHAKTECVQTPIKERSLVLVCSRNITDLMGSSEMSVFAREFCHAWL
ncbi:cell surface hyaluronidase-like isoform X3 [Aphelocoma coerulescens]|uniref:cell surface hyaluronidase-like isoform X3 n=1 Tax=Aphelocoma coerulescens TaxID=39617 RepID=UPI003604FF62